MKPQRKVLVIYEATQTRSPPRRLSLSTDGRGWFTIGSGGRDLPLNGTKSWKLVTEEIGRVCRLNGETELTLISLDRPLHAFKCVRDLLDCDGTTVRVALKSRTPDMDQRSRDVKRGKKREIEIRRAREGLARVCGLLDARERESRTSSGSNSTHSGENDLDSICVGDDFRSESPTTTTILPDRRRINDANSSSKRQKSFSAVVHVPYRFTRARAGAEPTSAMTTATAGATATPDAPGNVVISGAFGNGVYVLWTPVRLDSSDSNNGFKVLGYKVYLDGHMEAIVEGPLVSHVVLLEIQPNCEHEIYVKTRCKGIDSKPSLTVKYRLDSPSEKNALPQRLVEALNKLKKDTGASPMSTRLEVEAVAAEEAVDGVDFDKQSSVTSSSGIEMDDGENHRMPSFSAPPSPVRVPVATSPPDSPLDVKLTEDSADSLLVEWKPVELDSNGLNNGHRILGYKVYVNGKLVTRARGPKASSACLHESQIQTCSNPLTVIVKTQAIYLDSKPSDKCLFSSAVPTIQKFLCGSRDSIYSSDADRSRHASGAGKPTALPFFQMNKDDSGIFEQVSSPRNMQQTTRFTSSAIARLPTVGICSQKIDKTRACTETAL